jgi:hypothetical protein
LAETQPILSLFQRWHGRTESWSDGGFRDTISGMWWRHEMTGLAFNDTSRRNSSSQREAEEPIIIEVNAR